MNKLYEFEHAYQLKSVVEMLINDKASFLVAATLNRFGGVIGASEETHKYIQYCVDIGICKQVA